MTRPRPFRFGDPAMMLATWFGAGRLPWAPGTWGSLAALPFAWGITELGGRTALLGAVAIVFFVGWAAATGAARASRSSDPGWIVIDEVAGQWLTLAVAPLDPLAYTNEAKANLLGVPRTLLDSVGAVSAEVAASMAEGVLVRIPATGLAVSITGIAGPGGATPGKPVGLVYFGLARRGAATITEREIFLGDRAAIRAASVARALALLLAAASGS